MQATVTITLNSYTKRIHIAMIEGIEFEERNFRKPNAESQNWILKTLINVSADNILTISLMAIGRSLHKADAEILVQYRKNNVLIEKRENIEDDTFSQRGGILLFSKEIEL